jgi:hypothetical protein
MNEKNTNLENATMEEKRKPTWEGWEISEERPGYRVKHMKYKNATIELYRPILSDEEREKREQQLIEYIAPIVAPYIK